MFIRIHRYIPSTTVEGPGKRACIWVQGCPIHCTGCAVPLTWPMDGGTILEIETIANQILNESDIEGVTFVGGEPFIQAKELAKLGKIIRGTGLSIVTFTGFLLEQIQLSGFSDWIDLLNVTDLLIDGPYQQQLSDLSRPWVGSSNQRYHFLTNRYRHMELTLKNIPNKIEIRVKPNGTLLINGMGNFETLSEVFDKSLK